MKAALDQYQYEECLDIKPCYDVQYKFSLTPTYPNPMSQDTNISISYENYNVEYLEDSYVYGFISIFSEIGGSIGILIGLSCMTIVDFLIEVYKKIFKL